MKELTIQRKVHFRVGNNGQKHMEDGPQPPARVQRVSELMALAIHIEHLIETGELADRSEAARLAGITPARMTQIMNLLYLAPDIQEEILFLPRVGNRRDGVMEMQVRPISFMTNWQEQRETWRTLPD